jgi:AcrR family transcriptional regulator
MPALAADPTIRRQVMSAARDLLSTDSDAPVGAIARAAGVSRATFYRHFGSRAALLESVAHEPRPAARDRILAAAGEMLVRTSLTELSMDDLARAAGVSRGTLYRIFPGKPALLDGLIEAFSPFDALRAIVADHGDDPPDVFFGLVSRAVVGSAAEHLGVIRAIFQEATLGSDVAIAGIRLRFPATIGALVDYVVRQQAAGRIRPMHPLLALHAFIGPIYFHLMTRPLAEDLMGLPVDVPTAVEELTATSLRGIRA